MVNEDQVRVDAKCPTCKVVHTFEISKQGFDLRSRGANLIQAFPELPPERIIQLAHHVCPGCQHKHPKLMKLRALLNKPK